VFFGVYTEYRPVLGPPCRLKVGLLRIGMDRQMGEGP